MSPDDNKLEINNLENKDEIHSTSSELDSTNDFELDELEYASLDPNADQANATQKTTLKKKLNKKMLFYIGGVFLGLVLITSVYYIFFGNKKDKLTADSSIYPTEQTDKSDKSDDELVKDADIENFNKNIKSINESADSVNTKNIEGEEKTEIKEVDNKEKTSIKEVEDSHSKDASVKAPDKKITEKKGIVKNDAEKKEGEKKKGIVKKSEKSNKWGLKKPCFLISYSAYVDEKTAKDEKKKLAHQGFKVGYFYIPDIIENGRDLYKVYVGPYNSRDEADKKLGAVKKVKSTAYIEEIQ